LKHWIEAFRLRTLPLALACIGMGGIIAYMENGFQPVIFSLTLATAFLLQILSNIANDYGDSMNGADSEERVGPSRAVQTGKISATAMRNAMILFAVFSLASGLGLLYLSITTMQEFWIFLGMGLVCIVAAITYTVGKNPYGYAGLGDISVLIFFGLISVVGTYYLQVHELNWSIMLPAITCGLFAVGVLNVNNIRDIESDEKAGKYSIPVRLGREKAVVYHWFLLIGALILASIYVLLDFHGWQQFAFLLSIPFLYINGKAVQTKKIAMELDPYLKQMAISTVIFVLTFGIGQLL